MSGVEIAVVLGASLAGAFVKSVTGMGYPLLAVPLITLVLGIEDAVVVVAAPNVTMNFLLCWQARTGRHESRDLPLLLFASFAGAFVGVWLLVSVPEEPLLLLLAASIAAFLYQALRSPELRLAEATTRRWSPAVGAAAGVMQGAVGVSGPIVAAWLHGYRLRPTTYVFSVTAIFGLSGLVQLVLLGAAGEVSADRAFVSVLAFVPVLAMLPVGRRLRDRMHVEAFERAVLGVLALSGVALLVRVVA